MQQYFRDIYVSIYTVLVGMRLTFKQLFAPTVTIQYPDERRPIPERARNRLYVNIDDCIGCDQCSMACPVNCISIDTVKSVSGDEPGMTSLGTKKRLWVTKFDIDIAKCCYCALCVYPCPTDCIIMTDVYEFSEHNRNDLIYNFAAMTNEKIKDVKNKAEIAAKEAEEKKKIAAQTKVTPSPSSPTTSTQTI